METSETPTTASVVVGSLRLCVTTFVMPVVVAFLGPTKVLFHVRAAQRPTSSVSARTKQIGPQPLQGARVCVRVCVGGGGGGGGQSLTSIRHAPRSSSGPKAPPGGGEWPSAGGGGTQTEGSPRPPCVTLRCSFFTGPWTVTRSSLRLLRRVSAV